MYCLMDIQHLNQTDGNDSDRNSQKKGSQIDKVKEQKVERGIEQRKKNVKSNSNKPLILSKLYFRNPFLFLSHSLSHTLSQKDCSCHLAYFAFTHLENTFFPVVPEYLTNTILYSCVVDLPENHLIFH